MKLFHLSDLHLGKRLRGISLIEDQRDILWKIIGHIKAEKPDAVMIAGDIYDRSVPSEEAVLLLDDFLYELSEIGINVFIISGNHDSAERLAYGGRILNRNRIYISPEFNKNNYDLILKPITLNDEYGEVLFYLLPFVTPYAVRAARDGRAEADVSGWTDAVRTVIDEMNIDTSKRNVIIAHQPVKGAATCESETYSVGGAENIDVSVFEPFDYVALGHLHGPQTVEKDTVRYCGTPLKYSFSEAGHHKSISVVDIAEKGNVSVSTIPLDDPLHDMREIEGSFDEMVLKDKTEDYVRVTLTDQNEIIDAMNKLREFFPNIMQVRYKKDDDIGNIPEYTESERKAELSGMELFEEFYRLQTGSELNDDQAEIVRGIFEEIMGGKA